MIIMGGPCCTNAACDRDSCACAVESLGGALSVIAGSDFRRSVSMRRWVLLGPPRNGGRRRLFGEYLIEAGQYRVRIVFQQFGVLTLDSADFWAVGAP